MKSLNAKRIAAIAASLAVGLAFAGPVSFSNIPIINNAGQPVVQIVVGSRAQPSDSIVAANIAAVIGNLAYTSTPVTATVGNTGAVTCAVTTPSCTLSNQQVYLGEKGIVTATGSYTIRALIGSVLNAGVLNYNNLNYTKSLTSNPSYAYYEQSSSPYPITSPNPLPYSVFQGIGLSVPTSVVAGTNGGGLTFSSFTSSGYDNIVELTNAQVPGLMSASGPYSASESLWLYGFPVYDQATNNFELLDAGGAYELTFGKPIQIYTDNALHINHAGFTLLGENWTIYNITAAPAPVPSTEYVLGTSGSTKLQLAQSMTPLETVYVGHNITSGPFTVVLQDLSYPNSSGVSSAAIAVYKNGAGPYNETSIAPGQTKSLNVTGTPLSIYVSQTFPGLYAYQKWAKIQLFSNIFNITSGKVFNNEPGWYAQTLFTSNQSSGTPTQQDLALYGIILYSNQSATTNLAPGSSFDYITNPAVWKATFVGDSLGAPGSGNSNYDALSFSTSSQVLTYANPGPHSLIAAGNYYGINSTNDAFSTAAGGTPPYLAINNTAITEPTNLFTVTSQIPTAFQITAASPSPSPVSSVSTVQYNLDTYKLTPNAAVNTLEMSTSSYPNEGMLFTLASGGTGLSSNYVTTTNPLTVYVTGYKTGSSTPTTFTISFNSLTGTTTYPTLLGNVTNIKLGYAFPAPGVTLNAYATSNILSTQVTYASSPVNQTLIPSSDGYLTYNAATTNTLTTVGTNTLTLTIPANIIYEGQNDVISATATNAPITLAIMFGTNTLVSNSITTGTSPSNTVTLNANILYGLIGSNTLPTAYTVNAYEPGTSYSVTNSLIVVPELTLSYPENNIAAGTNDVITASVPANTFTTSIIPANAIAIEVNGATVAFNTAGSNTVTYNADRLGLTNDAPTTYTITANVLPYSDSFAAANQVITSNTLTVNPGALLLSSLTYSGPTLAYTVPQYSYYMAPSALTSKVVYTGESNYNVPFTLATATPSAAPSAATHYFTYTMPEITAPATGTP
ncbi:MAG: S-layer protein, partial [Candidatus Micrarchaeaceae archaeon]